MSVTEKLASNSSPPGLSRVPPLPKPARRCRSRTHTWPAEPVAKRTTTLPHLPSRLPDLHRLSSPANRLAWHWQMLHQASEPSHACRAPALRSSTVTERTNSVIATTPQTAQSNPSDPSLEKQSPQSECVALAGLISAKVVLSLASARGFCGEFKSDDDGS